MREVPVQWSVAVACCTNQRPEGATRASCGVERGKSLRRELRDRLRELGLREQVLVTTSGCLDVCPARGSTVAVLGPGGLRRTLVVGGDESIEPLVDLIIGCLATSDG